MKRVSTIAIFALFCWGVSVYSVIAASRDDVTALDLNRMSDKEVFAQEVARNLSKYFPSVLCPLILSYIAWRVKNKFTVLQADEYSCFCWSPCGLRFAVGCPIRIPDVRLRRRFGPADMRATVIDIRESTRGKFLYRLKGHSNKILALAWSPNGALLASIARDKTVRIWVLEEEEGKIQCSVKGPGRGWYASLAWSPCSELFAVSSSDSPRINLYDRAAHDHSILTCVGRRPGDLNGVTALAWSPCELLAAGLSGGSINIWDIQTKKLVRTLSEHHDTLIALAWRPLVHDQLVSSALDAAVVLWDITAKTILHQSSPYKVPAKVLAWSPDGYDLHISFENRQMWHWHIEKERKMYINRCKGYKSDLIALASRPTGVCAALAGGRVRIERIVSALELLKNWRDTDSVCQEEQEELGPRDNKTTKRVGCCSIS